MQFSKSIVCSIILMSSLNALASEPVVVEVGSQQGTIEAGGIQWWVLEIEEGNAGLDVIINADMRLQLGLFQNEGADEIALTTVASHKPQLQLRPEQMVGQLAPGTYWLQVSAPNNGGEYELTIADEIMRQRPGMFALDAPHPVPIGVDEEEVTGQLLDGMRIPVEVSENRGYETFVLDVPRKTKNVRLQFHSYGQDVDLHVRHGAIMEDYSVADAEAITMMAVEQMDLPTRLFGKVKPGLWYIDVNCPSSCPITGNLEVAFEAESDDAFYDNVLWDITDPLPLQTWVEGRVKRNERSYLSYAIEVPENTASLYIYTQNAQYDLDLFLKHGSPLDNWDDDQDHEALSARVDEVLVVEAEDGQSLESGMWFLDVVSLMDSDDEVGFEVQARLDPLPLEEGNSTAEIPQPPADLTPLERLLWSTVKLDGEGGSGSGTLIGPDGLILTNHHVIFDDDNGEVVEEMYVSMVSALDEAPIQAFVAEPIMYDEDLDLALVRINSDLQYRDLPEGTLFHYVEMGDSDALSLAQPVWVGGFPMVGGSASRSAVSVTRGVLAGWDRDVDGRPWIKTDARINAGNSGGAMFDEAGRLIGVPTMEMVVEDDELGYARPVHVLPEAWRELLPPEADEAEVTPAETTEDTE